MVSDEERAEFVPELSTSVVTAILAAGLIGKRVMVGGGRDSSRPKDNIVYGVKSLGQEDAALVFNDGREIRLNGLIDQIIIEEEPPEFGQISMGGFAPRPFGYGG